MTLKEAMEYCLPIIKSMKIKKANDMEAKVVLIDNILICTDSENSCMYTSIINNTGVTAAGFLDHIIMEQTIDKVKYVDINPTYSFNYRIYNELLSYYNFYTSRNYNYERYDMMQDEEILSLLSLKSSQGLQFYKTNDIATMIIPFFYGLVPVSKTDSLSMKASIGVDETIVNYTLFKKKLKCNINIYMRLLNLV